MRPNRLGFRFYPFLNEAYHGYLARLALDNGFTNTPTMLRWAQENLHLRSQDSAENVLKGLTNHPDAILENIPLKGPGPGKWRTHQIFGKDIPYLWLRARSDCFICPLCVLHIESTKLVWQFSWTQTCAVHDCELVNKCQSCSAPITYDKAARKKCGCGAIFETRSAKDKNQLAFDEAVESSLNGKHVPEICIELCAAPSPTKTFQYLRYEAILNSLRVQFQRLVHIG